MKFSKLSIILTAIAITATSKAGEIGFEETFSLAENREAVLKQLVPGTEEYYFYKCLHLQNQKKYGEVEKLLGTWIQRHRNSNKIREMKLRQALLTFKQNPEKSLSFLKYHLGLHFNHQREKPTKEQNYPTALDPSLISFETLYKQALNNNSQTVSGFSAPAFELIANRSNLGPFRRRDLLKRLTRPDVPNLPKLVVEDLKFKHSRGFGKMTIHHKLTLKQLKSCLELMPNLRDNTNFINIYVSKLRPNAFSAWRSNLKLHQAYLDRLWSFTKTLSPAHNSLKANVLYKILQLGLEKGEYNKSLFLEYLKYPRNVSYINQKYLKRINPRQNQWVNLNSDFSKYTALPPINDDYKLTRKYLLRFYKDANDWREFATYVKDTVLKPIFAEAKIINGIGDQEKWCSMLSPSEYQRLKERVDLDFDPTNQKYFAPDAQVSLGLEIKNVKRLFVKIYKINLLSYFQEQGREPSLDINLEGMTPNWEKEFDYSKTSSPFLRIKRDFPLDFCDSRGAYIIEFIGGGKTSRALVRKGRLRYTANICAAGKIVRVYDENNQLVKNASARIGGHLYHADENGMIIIPFSTKLGKSGPIILSDNDFHSLAKFHHPHERYELKVGFHIDRESLISLAESEVVVRPMLYLNRYPVSLTVLKDISLTVTTTDLDGVKSEKVIPKFKIQDDKDSIFTFKVPSQLRQIQFALKAKVRNVSQGKDQNLRQVEKFAVNGIDHSDNIDELLLRKVKDQYFLVALGKDGSPKADKRVDLMLKNKYFANSVKVRLKTDKQGRVTLGALKDISQLMATLEDVYRLGHFFNENLTTLPRMMNLPTGVSCQIPYFGKNAKLSPKNASLLESGKNGFVANYFDKLSLKNSCLSIAGLPEGSYSLLLKDSGQEVSIKVIKGVVEQNVALGETVVGQISNLKPTLLRELRVDGKDLVIKVDNINDFTRVHVFADRFLTPPSQFNAFRNFTLLPEPWPELVNWPKTRSFYQAGKKISEEYEYIIKRKFAKKFPGNMLQRPGLILNPFILKDTKTQAQRQAQAGEAFDRKKAEAQGFREGKGYGVGGFGRGKSSSGLFLIDDLGTETPTLDFLSKPALVLLNLRPDAKGEIRLPVKTFGPHQDVTVVTLGRIATMVRKIALSEHEMPRRDVRLVNNLDPAKHFIETKKVTPVLKGGKLVIEDLTTSKVKVFSSLAQAYDLMKTLNNNKTLNEFDFLRHWKNMEDEEKLEKHSKYACHELNYFIFKKDPEFFAKHVKPYLANKMDRTFMDLCLLDAPLKSYLTPWLYRGRLNVVEKILLASKISGESSKTKRFIQEAFEMLPEDPKHFDQLFNTALRSGDLGLKDPLAPPPASKSRAARAPRDAKMPMEKLAKAEVAALADLADEGSMWKKSRRKADKGKYEKKYKERPKSRKASFSPSFKPMKKLGAKRLAQLHKNVKRFYKKIEQTKELAENNYYKLPIEAQNSSLVTVNAFWNEFAARNSKQPFLSGAFPYATGNFTEMALALASLDLPMTPGKLKTQYDQAKMTLSGTSPFIVFHREITQVQPASAEQAGKVLVSQDYFEASDRWRYEGNKKFFKFVSDEFLTNVVYGCHLVVTNPSSAQREFEVLLQIPKGAVPVASGFKTKSIRLNMPGYQTKTFDYYFYFPTAGEFPVYPAQISEKGSLVAFCENRKMKVAARLATADRASWNYISQNGSDKQVLEYLKKHNLNRIDLNRIAFRMRDGAFFKQVIEFLDANHFYNPTLWGYAFSHKIPKAMCQYLENSNVPNECGAFIDTPLLTVDPVERRSYQFLEYDPLVNARTYQLGQKRSILNNSFFKQYKNLMKTLSYRPVLDQDDLMSVTYYMLLQDRVAEAFRFFKQVKPEKLATRLQYDYFKTYLAFYQAKPELAAKIAAKYQDYPVKRWREKFQEALNQAAEIKGANPKVINPDSRDQAMTQLASKEPSLELKIEGQKLEVSHANLKNATVNYYLFDIELLFSRQPFMRDYGKQFSVIMPNKSEALDLPKDGKTKIFEIPKEFAAKNLLVEVTGGGAKTSAAYFANSMQVRLEENYGQIKVLDSKSNTPLPTVYVKCYARMKNGKVKFYKDGYTDLRGRFEYSSLSSNELDQVDKFAVLILSEKHGAVVKEAKPPKQ